MSVGESAGGLPPDSLVEAEPAILADMVRVVDAFHDPAPGAMVRVGLAPCSPFSVSTGLMADAAALARDKGVMLHTHLAENDEDIAYSLAQFGCRPGQYAEDLGWTGEHVWHAHCVKLDAGEIELFARSGTGVAHCPCSNSRLGSGIAPVRQMRDAGVKVGARGGRLGEQRRGAPALRGAAGDAAAAGAERRRRHERAGDAGDRDPRRGGGAGARGGARVDRAGQARRPRGLGRVAGSGRPGPGIRWRRCCSAGRSRCATWWSRGGGWCARGGWPGWRSRRWWSGRTGAWRG